MDRFWTWWQHLPEHINPLLIEIGVLKIQYYGLMYLVAFGLTYILVIYRNRTEDRFDLTLDQINTLTTYLILGLIIGARIGYVLVYSLPYYAQHPLQIVLPFSFENGVTFTGIAGMSYHGGLVGVLIAGYLYIRKNGLDFWRLVDLYVPAIPLGYTFGRLGNFINGELFGRVTASPIGMYFPLAPDDAARHPSQLYEAFFEGIVLFGVLWLLRKRVRRPDGVFLCLYLFGYGLVRFGIEFFRQPDPQLGFILPGISMGQILCGLMMLGAGALYLFLRRRQTALETVRSGKKRSRSRRSVNRG